MRVGGKGSAWATWCGVVLLLLGAYVGAYYKTVDVFVDDGVISPIYFIAHGLYDDHSAIGVLFGPMHAIDRRIRPKNWTAPKSIWVP